MTVRAIHVLDESTTEDAARLASLLLRRLPQDRVEQRVVMIGRTPPALLIPEDVSVHKVSRGFGWPMAAIPELNRTIQRFHPDAVLTWGMTAAAAVRGSRRSTIPMVTTVTDPADARRSSRWWRSLHDEAGAVDVICTSQFVQRRLVESGVPLKSTVVIRPGIDFGELRVARERMNRASLGLPEKGRVLLMPSPPSRAGGHFYGVWAAAILHQIWPDAVMLIPGRSREHQRLLRLIDSIYCKQIMYPTAYRYTPAELVAISDALIVPAVDDIETGWLAWAMSASVPIIGSAVPSVAELIADRHNGCLCKPGEPYTLAVRIRTAFESSDTLRQCVETARGQAYDVFRAQRCVDEYLKTIENMGAGARPIDRVQDAAIDA